MMGGVVRSALIRWTVGGVLGLGAVVLLFSQAPRLLRKLELFRVERVEVVGTRYLAPHLVLEASGITEESSLFDDPAPWRAALLEHPLVADLAIEREYPGTLILRVVEVEPVALVATPVLRPVDAEGRLLPIDPAVLDVDLPVIGAEVESDAEGRVADGEVLGLIASLDRLGRTAPWLVARTSAVAPVERGGMRLLLRDPAQGEALLPEDFTALRVEQLRLALADLDAKRELSRLRRIDVRYRDQVVVSLTSS